MADDYQNPQYVIDMYTNIGKALEKIPPYKRKQIQGIEIIFADTVNGRLKGRCCSEFLDVLIANVDGSKPVGLTIYWSLGSPDGMEVAEFPGLSVEEQQLVMSEFAQAQDEFKREFSDEDEDH